MRIGNNIQTVPPAVYRVYSPQIGQKNGQKTIVKFIETLTIPTVAKLQYHSPVHPGVQNFFTISQISLFGCASWHLCKMISIDINLLL